MRESGSDKTTTIAVYLLSWDPVTKHDVLVPRNRTIRGGPTRQLLTRVISELLAGPLSEEKQRGDASAIPPETKLLGARIDDDIATLDLSEDIERGGGSSTVRARVYQLVYTATGIPGVTSVKIIINGKHREALSGEGFVIAEPIERPSVPPQF